jgi:hypothetical protein
LTATALKWMNSPVLVHMQLSSTYMNHSIPSFVKSLTLDRYPSSFTADAMQEPGPSRLPPGDNKIWVRDVDDWLGVTNRQERRKIQNRRNQRALRREFPPATQPALTTSQEPRRTGHPRRRTQRPSPTA